MKEAGLTHGGFYAHFDSRDALLAEAVDQAGAESLESLSRAVAGAKPGEELQALIDSYLSDRHLQAPEQGLGFERLLMFVTGVSNIRDVIPFARTPGNAEF